MSCELCKKIWDSIDAYQGNFSYPCEEKIGIVTQWKEPWLYVPCEGDDYFSDAVMQINYCPKCGRKLIENKAQRVNDHMIRVCESDDFIVDYFKDKGMYRVSIFEDGHFQDEYWFDAYEV